MLANVSALLTTTLISLYHPDYASIPRHLSLDSLTLFVATETPEITKKSTLGERNMIRLLHPLKDLQ